MLEHQLLFKEYLTYTTKEVSYDAKHWKNQNSEETVTIQRLYFQCRTTSVEAALVVARMLPNDILTEEIRKLYNWMVRGNQCRRARTKAGGHRS